MHCGDTDLAHSYLVRQNSLHDGPATWETGFGGRFVVGGLLEELSLNEGDDEVVEPLLRDQGSFDGRYELVVGVEAHLDLPTEDRARSHDISGTDRKQLPDCNGACVAGQRRRKDSHRDHLYRMTASLLVEESIDVAPKYSEILDKSIGLEHFLLDMIVGEFSLNVLHIRSRKARTPLMNEC
jgi:hypothetical protein